MKIFCVLTGLLVATVTAAGCAGESGLSGGTSKSVARRDTAMIDSVPTCLTCSITVVDSVSIGTPKDTLIPHRVPGFLRDSRGKHYLTFVGWSNQLVLTYDSLGAYQGVIGQYGQGPGEYRHTSAALLGPGDSLFVFEGNLIGHVFAPNGKYARRADVKGGRPFAVSPDNTAPILVMQREHLRASTASQFVLRFAAHARLMDSFPVFAVATGRTREFTSDKEKYSRVDVLRSDAYGASDGSIWTLSSTNYRLEQHDSQGVPRKLFGVQVAGAPAPLLNEADMRAAEAAKRYVPTNPHILSSKTRKLLRPVRWLDVDREGLVWVTRQVAAPGWDTIATKGQKLSPNEAPDEETIPREIEDRRYHTVIEVIDPKVGQLLARIELPFLGERVSAGFVGRVVADDDGFFKPIVYRLQLKR